MLHGGLEGAALFVERSQPHRGRPRKFRLRLGAAQIEQADLAGLQLAAHLGGIAGEEVDMAADQGADRLAAALIGEIAHLAGIDAGRL